jgi:hypothetical protein
VAIQAVAFDIGDVLERMELVFLDDVPGHVDVACQLGIHGIVHVAAPDSIAAVEALIDHG